MIRAVLWPALAIAFFVGFGGFFVYGGFQSATIELRRDSTGAVHGTLTRAHLLGLYTVSTELRGVRRAKLETSETHPKPGLTSLVSRVVLETPSGRVAVFAGFSNVDEAYKHHVVRVVNAHLRRGDHRVFHETFTLRNLFGWVGLPFLVVGLYGAVSWPVTLVSRWRQRGDGPAADS